MTDTTFIRTRKGWLFLAIVLDLYSRKVVGWSMSDRNNTQLVSDALTMAFWRRKVGNKIIVHSDQGSTYASFSYRKLIADNSGLCSMSRKGDCYDNAIAESFFSSLKPSMLIMKTTEQENKQGKVFLNISSYSTIDGGGILTWTMSVQMNTNGQLPTIK